MSKSIWHDCKKQPPLVDDSELVLMDSNDKFWVGFCEITSDGVSYFANNAADPLKNDFVKYARIDKLLTLETELDRTRKALDVAVDAIDEILVLDSGKFIQEPAEMWKIAKSAKDKITALEQKE